MYSRRLMAIFAALALGGAVVACDDNAEDHMEEAREEMSEGDLEDASESMEDAREDLEQGDTTELLN